VLKKLSLIILIAVFAYGQVGYYIVMHHSQSVQKEVIKEKILSQFKEDELEIISVSDNHKQIYWEEEGKEFSLNGQMYDVVKRVIVSGKVMLYCINDKKERQLVDDYNSITKHNSSSDKKGKNTIDNSFNLFVYYDEKNSDQYFILAANKFHSFVSHLTESIDDNISPPPKA
jgi:hypothetical protein